MNLKNLVNLRKYICAWLIPFVFLPILGLIPNETGKGAYVIITMAFLWLTEALPIAVTALIPVAIFPLLGLMSTEQACQPYAKGILMLFLGSMAAAIAVENSNLHNRLSLRILLMFGTSPKWLLLAFMLNTMLLSMWISNTASSALMVPIVDAIIVQLRHRTNFRKGSQDRRVSIISSLDLKSDDYTHRRRSSIVIYEDPSVDPESFARLKKSIYLGICYAANIGGTGTITGTSTNLVLYGLLTNKESMRGLENQLTFSNWMFFNILPMFTCVLCAWIFIYFVYVRNSIYSPSEEQQKLVQQSIRSKFNLLGPITCHELFSLIVFLVMVLLWLLRDPEFMTGWGPRISKNIDIGDSTAAIFMMIILFMIPSDPMNSNSEPLLTWKAFQAKMPWNVYLLIGGGFALAKGSEMSGISEWLGNTLAGLKNTSSLVFSIITCTLALILTEIASNAATATILLPAIRNMAFALKKNPFYFMLPTTVACSYSFILPIASPPNAIAFEAAEMKIKDMMIPGILMKIICLIILLFFVNTWGYVIYSFPDISNNATLPI